MLFFPGAMISRCSFKRHSAREGSYNCKEMEIDIGRVANVDIHLAPFYSIGPASMGDSLYTRESFPD